MLAGKIPRERRVKSVEPVSLWQRLVCWIMLDRLEVFGLGRASAGDH
jgi:hypothetical protein